MATIPPHKSIQQQRELDLVLVIDKSFATSVEFPKILDGIIVPLMKAAKSHQVLASVDPSNPGVAQSIRFGAVFYGGGDRISGSSLLSAAESSISSSVLVDSKMLTSDGNAFYRYLKAYDFNGVERGSGRTAMLEGLIASLELFDERERQVTEEAASLNQTLPVGFFSRHCVVVSSTLAHNLPALANSNPRFDGASWANIGGMMAQMDVHFSYILSRHTPEMLDTLRQIQSMDAPIFDMPSLKYAVRMAHLNFSSPHLEMEGPPSSTSSSSTTVDPKAQVLAGNKRPIEASLNGAELDVSNPLKRNKTELFKAVLPPQIPAQTLQRSTTDPNLAATRRIPLAGTSETTTAPQGMNSNLFGGAAMLSSATPMQQALQRQQANGTNQHHSGAQSNFAQATPMHGTVPLGKIVWYGQISLKINKYELVSVVAASIPDAQSELELQTPSWPNKLVLYPSQLEVSELLMLIKRSAVPMAQFRVQPSQSVMNNAENFQQIQQLLLGTKLVAVSRFPSSHNQGLAIFPYKSNLIVAAFVNIPLPDSLSNAALPKAAAPTPRFPQQQQQMMSTHLQQPPGPHLSQHVSNGMFQTQNTVLTPQQQLMYIEQLQKQQGLQ